MVNAMTKVPFLTSSIPESSGDVVSGLAFHILRAFCWCLVLLTPFQRQAELSARRTGIRKRPGRNWGRAGTESSNVVQPPTSLSYLCGFGSPPSGGSQVPSTKQDREQESGP